ncbi:MAG: hypothetical protein ABIZ09_11585 [Rhodoferax sp.]|jgi:uncharacterized membrane protein
MRYKKIALSIVFLWFLIGGMGHFLAPDFFLKIIPPGLPFRLEAVYISGFFELLGALALTSLRYRRIAGVGLFLLTIAVTPANIYMLMNPKIFSTVPEVLLWLRLVLQIILLWAIWWSTLPLKKIVIVDAHAV